MFVYASHRGHRGHGGGAPDGDGEVTERNERTWRGLLTASKSTEDGRKGGREKE